ncbi:MAG: hypothetical protein A2V81_03235 [Candidatus Abawacabacteria bacterium RBG_16_42_10]|uniref:Uncharacterized protein n=1 Tax=Candidatus Abawacabacteria bacterium RBG_16_42_10 TaxID=1817814 RepID=A0A1F4XKC7_9BACT|nr:MAG: hypothetical protein A2V81_03235 [Candidatus Abawacabacteria bacterium RBG_16_42_10]
MTACGQLPSLVSPSPSSPSSPSSLSSFSHDVDSINIDNIGDEEMAKILAEFSGTDSLDAFDAELSQVDVNDTDTDLGKIEKGL